MIDQKACYETDLIEYVKQDEIDGTKIQNDWFPQVNADIFISHSHKDEDLACALAGWLNHNFNLNCFIDSNVWGYSEVLLEEMNSNLSNKRDYEGGYLYNYKSCNQVSQHVNTMLSIALQKMIDRVECVIFLNTNNAVKIYNDTQMEKTYSPWIYSEIVYTQIVRKKPLLAYRNYPSVVKKYVAAYESVQFVMHSAISYSISLKHLNQINKDDLDNWFTKYLFGEYEYALDALYEFICPQDVDDTKRLFLQLQSNDIESLQQAYLIENVNFEEGEEVQFVWQNIIDKYWRNCLECDRCKYVLYE